MTIGIRLRQRRLSLGYTLDDLRELIIKQGITISKASLSKYELNKSIPKATNLFYVAKALKVTPDYFLKETDFHIKWIAFRKTSKLTKTEENRIKYIAKEQVEANLFLSDIIDQPQSKTSLPEFNINSLEEADSAADSLRENWKINNWPIDSLTNLLEEKSVFIVDVDSTKGFDGLSGKIDDDMPLIITIGHNSVDRKRMSIAHELGHLVLKVNGLDEEKAAFRFAAALLMPQKCIISILGKKRHNIDIRELLLIKEEYGISIQALIRRCFDLDIISENEYRRLNIYMRSNGMYKNEPGNCTNKEVPIKIKSKLLRVISEGITTESEVFSRFPNLSAEIEGNDMLENLNEKTNDEKIELMEAAAKKISSEYSTNGSLDGFEIYDDIMDS
jgi:Zn-dependent peptidase ImmA (M78 family)